MPDTTAPDTTAPDTTAPDTTAPDTTAPDTTAPARILIAKPGLDGHDRGAKIIARTLRDAGFEVIFTGIRQKVDAIVAAAVQEDVAVVGLSILSGAHLALTAKVIDGLRAAGADDIAVVVGGTIPAADVAKLRVVGVAAVFPTGTPLDSVVSEIKIVISNGPWSH